jgi:hypothetical protein
VLVFQRLDSLLDLGLGQIALRLENVLSKAVDELPSSSALRRFRRLVALYDKLMKSASMKYITRDRVYLDFLPIPGFL